ncbi:nucleocapsid [Pidgey virus]|uniref:Nucleoprotein n=1 Tax=Pidgey virus TaxID=1911436 RepID=A0A2Z2CF67_9VIRU|nr:nucleocapsid [Pidgey virus]AOX47532.1 nucleocapsid [Pidgey virus]
MSSILDELVKSFNIDSTIDTNWIQNLVDDYAYQGLDMTTIITYINDVLKTKPEGKAALMLLIGIGLTRGNKLEKILGSLNTNSQAKLSNGISLFNVKSSIRDANRTTTLTLARLRVAVPQIAAKILDDSRIVRPVSMSELKMFSPIFPAVFRDNCIASLIVKDVVNGFDKDVINNCLLHLYVYNFLESTKLFNPKLAVKGTPESKASQFIRAAWNSTHVSDKARKTFMTTYVHPRMSIINESGEHLMNHMKKEKMEIPIFLMD